MCMHVYMLFATKWSSGAARPNGTQRQTAQHLSLSAQTMGQMPHKPLTIHVSPSREYASDRSPHQPR